MNIKEISEEIHDNEMCEADRKNIHCFVIPNPSYGTNDEYKEYFEQHVKDTFEDELADTVIRLLDMAKKLDIPLESHVLAKMRYNSLRPYKHGKAY
jgi:NTP pyrophosphatase (non-canonical NTP hydrolase)